MLTEREKIIQCINFLNKRITFKLLPAISEALNSMDLVHRQLMDKYIELIELSKKTGENNGN